ncbi:hypothetical protein Vi05172_g3445 [Venturia inaequalis]|nr:hypothetical protein Vi05172_g3445 [Venturia inaequalis]
MKWASYPTETTIQSDKKPTDLNNPFVIQLVRQINFGAIESKRYFLIDETNDTFLEVTEADLIEANYEKLNAYKNFKCAAHNRFFEVNVYEKNAVNAHHWRHNIARPGGEIDL